MTPEDARERFDYDPDTGLLRWKIRPANRVKVGDIAGSLNPEGYIQVGGKGHAAHRLAWLITYGEWPSGEIDHINGIRDDNRIVNLRCVSKSENSRNRTCHRNGQLLGASPTKINKKNPWTAQIRINGKQTRLGYFPTEQLAHEAYLAALNCQGCD